MGGIYTKNNQLMENDIYVFVRVQNTRCIAIWNVSDCILMHSNG